MKISIIGAGNIGTALAADLARKHEITLFSSKPDCVKSSITYVDSETKTSFVAELSHITNCYSDVTDGCEILFIALPTFLLKKTVDGLLPYINKETIVGFLPGAGGVEFISKPLLDRGNTIFGFERVPYVSRLASYGESVIASKKASYRVAVLPSKRGREISELIGKLLGRPCKVMNEFISMTLTPTLHVSRLYGLYHDYQLGDILNENPFFYGEWRDIDSKICLELDMELHRVCRELEKYGLQTGELVPYTVHYESPTPEALTRKLRSIPSLQGIYGPVMEISKGKYQLDLNSRYFTESFPYRLAIVKGISECISVHTPLTDRVLTWYAKLSNKEYFVNNQFIGRDIVECCIPQNYGIKSIEQLLRLYSEEGEN